MLDDDCMERNVIDLYTLQSELRSGVESLFPERLWVRAEISSVSVKAGGHCYLDLVQMRDGVALAKARAVIWKSRYIMLSSYFREAAGCGLQAGMTILARVQVTYSELYGMTLTIDDLDAGVTLGEQERIRQETITRLTAEGMMDLQQQLELVRLPYRLAVISAREAAGYGDFCHHLLDNEYGFKFCVDLFEAVMQGAQAPQSISEALEEVQCSPVPYDAVLILRGGGSKFDLSCFDDYGLCFNIASCGIPVFTAIGHDRDYHVADMAAFAHLKTPTALADELLDIYMAEDERIASFCSRLRLAFVGRVNEMSSRLELLCSRIKSADPRGILARGYVLATDARGVLLKSVSQVAEGDGIRVMFGDGGINCTVNGKI